jgi:hypothetical protein
MRQCLRIVYYCHKTKELWAQSKHLVPESAKAAKNWSFHVLKLATAVIDSVNFVSAGNAGRDDEMKLWNRLRSEAKQLLELDMQKTSAKTAEPAAQEFKPQASDSEKRGRRPLTKYEMAFGG